MRIGPFGPDGYEIKIAYTTPHATYCVALAPLSWGIAFCAQKGKVFDFSMLQVGPIKFVVQSAVWETDA